MFPSLWKEVSVWTSAHPPSVGKLEKPPFHFHILNPSVWSLLIDTCLQKFKVWVNCKGIDYHLKEEREMSRALSYAKATGLWSLLFSLGPTLCPDFPAYQKEVTLFLLLHLMFQFLGRSQIKLSSHYPLGMWWINCRLHVGGVSIIGGVLAQPFGK